MKAISNFIALMIAIAIAVGVAIVVAMIIPPMLSNNTPKKGVLSIGGSEAVYDTTSKMLWIDVRGYYSGSEPANILGVYVLADAGSIANIVLNTCYVYICIGSCPSASCRVIDLIFIYILICNNPISVSDSCFFIASYPCSSIYNVNLISVTPLSQVSSVDPNSYFKISLRSTSQINSPPPNIVIIVRYCFSDNTCYFSSEIIPVKTG